MTDQKEVIPPTLAAPACGPRATSVGRPHRASTSGHPRHRITSTGNPSGSESRQRNAVGIRRRCQQLFSFGIDR